MIDRLQEKTEFWRHAAFRDLGLLRARFRQHRYERHTHPDYVIALITEGCERVRIGNTTVHAPAGSVLVVNPEEWHDGEAGIDEGWAYRTFYPSIGLVSGVAEELGHLAAPCFPRSVINDRELAQMLAAAHLASVSPDATHAEATMLAALHRLILDYDSRIGWREHIQPSGSRYRLSLYEQMIEDHLADGIDLRRLAETAGVTRFQVIRDFKKVTGLTPASFIRDRRLRRASHLIDQGSSLADAALSAGFADQSHLSRTFRAVHGFTPGMLKKAGINLTTRSR